MVSRIAQTRAGSRVRRGRWEGGEGRGKKGAVSFSHAPEKFGRSRRRAPQELFAEFFINLRMPSGVCSCRWAPLLDVYTRRWRGFGAALLVRLIEALIADALRQDPCSVEGGDQSVSLDELERRGVLIGVWVRHLLSRRWHVRSGNVSPSWGCLFTWQGSIYHECRRAHDASHESIGGRCW